jgi:hypothetical protein
MAQAHSLRQTAINDVLSSAQQNYKAARAKYDALRASIAAQGISHVGTHRVEVAFGQLAEAAEELRLAEGKAASSGSTTYESHVKYLAWLETFKQSEDSSSKKPSRSAKA